MRISTLLPLFFLSLLFWSCSDDTKSSTLQLNPFPNKSYEKIIAFKMNGDNLNVINDQNKLSNGVVGEGVVLTKDQETKLLAIYRSEESYGSDFYRCFEPHLGFVFYDENEQIVAHSTVCFLCNWMRTSPDIGGNIFSRKGAQELVELEGDIFDVL
ncbi:MAG: hypothetical protein AB8F74_03090 [Saprospiraceae bacterium]